MNNFLKAFFLSLAFACGLGAQTTMFMWSANAGQVTPAAPSGGAATFSSVTDTGLTSGRFVLVGTGGLLQDSANFTYVDGTTTGQAIFPVGAVGTPSVTFLGDTNTGFYWVSADKVGLAIGGAVNTQWVGVNTLFGGLTTNGTGVLQLPVGTTTAGGIAFGTTSNLYAKSTTSMGLVTNSVLAFSFTNNGSNSDITFGTNAGSLTNLALITGQAGVDVTITALASQNVILKSGGATALTLDSSQNATFVGTAKALGFLNTTGTSANSGNGMVQRFRNGYATAAQAPTATTRTYITGSDVGPFTAGQLAVGTFIHWHLEISKTAAGTASATFDIAFGTAGSTSDTARVTFTKPAGTAQIDNCSVDIWAQVKTNSASGVVVGDFTMVVDQTSATLGGFLAAAKYVSHPALVTSGTFDTTTPTHVGLCVTTGASDAWTINKVEAYTFNL